MKKLKSDNFLFVDEIISVLILIAGLLFMSVPDKVQSVMPYFVTIYISASAVIRFFAWSMTRNKKTLIESIIRSVLAVAAILLFALLDDRKTALAISMGAYCILTSAQSFVYFMLGDKKRGDILFMAINMLIHLMLAVFIFYCLAKGSSPINEFIAIYGIIFIFEGVVYFFTAFTKKHHGPLFEILKETHARDILSGLILAIIAASFILIFIEPQIDTFGEGIWYCFALVTTIGFGDIAAVTALGRMISVFIGLYGIIVVALITSIIVNIYNDKKEREKENKEKDIKSE